MKSRKKRIPEIGEVFAVRLSDGTFAVAQVAALFDFSSGAFITCAFFRFREDSKDAVQSNLESYDLSLPVSVFTLSGDIDKPWTSVGIRPAVYENIDVQSRLKGDWQWFDGQQRPWFFFLEAYHGLFPWDGLYRPDYIDILLLPGAGRPAGAKMKVDFPPDFLKRYGV